VEHKLAAKLGIRMGDRLTFLIAGRRLQARVASLRSVQWESFHPNFYMIFPPGVLDDFPATYMTGFHLAGTQKSVLIDLVRNFPAVTVLEIDRIIEQVRRILTQATLAVEYLLVFVLLAGLTVLFAALHASLDERLHEGALLRALGASRTQLRTGHIMEFSLLGMLAGVLAAMGTEFIAWLLYQRILQLEYSMKWPVWLLTPLAGALVVGLAGFLGTRRVVQHPPIKVLRDL
jgi:putative ABC transport system permease protein